MSILWDEKKLEDLNSDEMLKEIIHIYSEYQKELATVSDVSYGSLFFGLATESDAVLIKSLLNLPLELRSKLLYYIQTNFKPLESVSENQVSTIGDTNTPRKSELKDLLLTSPHKDLEIQIARQTDTGRDIMI